MTTLNKSDRTRKAQPSEPAPWRSMPEAEALEYLASRDAKRRTVEAKSQAARLSLQGMANLRQLRAWRLSHGLCHKCGVAIIAPSPFKHCPACRLGFRKQQRRVTRTLTEPQRLARNERERQRYHKVVNGRPAPPKVVTPKVTQAVTPPPPVVTHKTGSDPKRDRAEYMREYRARQRRASR